MAEGEGDDDVGDEEEDEDEALPCSVLFLLSAHDLLGKRGWCTVNEGRLVLYMIEVVLHSIDFVPFP